MVQSTFRCVRFTRPNHGFSVVTYRISCSRNPHCTAVFCAVPRNRNFFGVYIRAILAHVCPGQNPLLAQPSPVCFWQFWSVVRARFFGGELSMVLRRG